VALDIVEVETLFQTKVVNKEEEAAKSDAAPKNVAITLIDKKKATNCAIMLSQFKIPYKVSFILKSFADYSSGFARCYN
jgi:hypothetical protein